MAKIRYTEDINKNDNQNRSASPSEVQKYRNLAGELVLVGYSVLSQAAHFGSYMQQNVLRLKFRDFLEAKKKSGRTRGLTPGSKISSTTFGNTLTGSNIFGSSFQH